MPHGALPSPAGSDHRASAVECPQSLGVSGRVKRARLMGGRGSGRKRSAEECGRVHIYLKLLLLSQEGEECPVLPLLSLCPAKCCRFFSTGVLKSEQRAWGGVRDFQQLESQHRGEGLSLKPSMGISGGCVGLGQEGPCPAAVTATPCCHCHPSSAWR